MTLPLGPTLRDAADAWYEAQGWDERLPQGASPATHDLVMAIRVERARPIDDAHSLVDLGFCVGKECIRRHGVRVATYRGTGPASIYVVCDECHAERLTPEERAHMVEVRGAEWIRHLGLQGLDRGRLPREQGEAPTVAAETCAVCHARPAVIFDLCAECEERQHSIGGTWDGASLERLRTETDGERSDEG